VIVRFAPFALILLTALGCSSTRSKPAAQHRIPPVDPWVITSLDPNVDAPALLWNGLLGARLPLSGPYEGTVFDSRNYQLTGEEKLQPLPFSVALVAECEDRDLTPIDSEDYKGTLDMKSGEIVQSWTPKADSNWRIEVRSVMDPDRRILAQKWSFEPRRDAKIQLLSVGEFKVVSSSDTERRMKAGTGVAVAQIVDRIENQSPGSWSDYGGLQRWEGGVDSDPSLIFERIVSTEPTPILDEDTFESIKARSSQRTGIADIEIDGPVEDQQAIRSFIHYLRTAIHPTGRMAISPMGLSSETYNGHVFWDADIWVFPALALIDPDRAKAIPKYRLRRSYEWAGGYDADPQYAKNIRDWIADGRPIGNGKMGAPTDALWREGSALKVPWESSVTGRETVLGPSKFQDHVTGSVHFMLRQADALGLANASNVTRFTQGATDFYLQRISQRPDGKYDLKGTMSPDENHIGDNDLYTNLVAQSVIDDGLWKMGQDQRPQLFLPKDDKTFLTYENDPVRSYKQAAAVLSIYPLQYPPAEAQAPAMMTRFADKVSKNGPAMTDSIHSIIWSRLGDKDKAYKAWQESWKPFVKPPFLLFSEKRNSSRTYFTTGAAGSLQAVLYGFAGLRIDNQKGPRAQWSMPLRNGMILSLAPSLPKEWRRLTLRNLRILGKRLTITIEGDKVRVESK